MTPATPVVVRASGVGRDRLVVAAARHPSVADRPRSLGGPPGPVAHRLANGRYQSPLRYPGAKSGLSRVIGGLVEAAKRSRQVKQIDLFVEPFAGGASTSLRLVGAGIVDRILLADADPLVASFWQVAAAEPEALVDRMSDEHARFVARGGPIALDRWDHWRRWIPPAGMSGFVARRETAMKCLFLNRTTFSGILHGQAGPIGGRLQESAYGIGCRYSVEGLAERIRYVGHLYANRRLVDVWCKDWKATLDDVPEWYPGLIPDRVVAYLDPPYLNKSPKLYQKSFDENGFRSGDVESTWASGLAHYRLAEYLRCRIPLRWVLSYDADSVLLSDRSLYAARRMSPSASEREDFGAKSWQISRRFVSLTYSASARSGRRMANELLLTTLPPATVPVDDVFRPVDPSIG